MLSDRQLKKLERAGLVIVDSRSVMILEQQINYLQAYVRQLQDRLMARNLEEYKASQIEIVLPDRVDKPDFENYAGEVVNEDPQTS